MSAAAAGSLVFPRTRRRLAGNTIIYGVCWAIVGVYVAETTNGSSQGIGFMMANATSTFQTAQFFVGLFIIGCAGILLTSVVALLQRRLQHGGAAR